MCEVIDFDRERLLSLDEIADRFPGVNRRRLSYETVRRWATCGLSGKRLATVKVGGRRMSSLEAVKRFFADLEGPAAIDPVQQDRELRDRADIARAMLRSEFGVTAR
jgi:hypothetical protein